MAEYIEREVAIRALELHECDTSRAIVSILNAPAADVVSRDELEALISDMRAFTKQWWEERNGFPCRFCKFHLDPGGCTSKERNQANCVCAGRFFEWRGIRDSMVEEAPAVDVAPVVHGRWEDVQETEMYVPDMKFTTAKTEETCSECKARIGFIGAKQYLFDSVCPNCGAKMDLEG